MSKEKQKGTPINLKDKVTVFATGKHKYQKQGTEIVCHPLLAEYMIKNGQATDKVTKAKEA